MEDVIDVGTYLNENCTATAYCGLVTEGFIYIFE